MALQALKKRESFSDKAYQMLREAILTGELKPGEQLTEEALSAQLGISRTQSIEHFPFALFFTFSMALSREMFSLLAFRYSCRSFSLCSPVAFSTLSCTACNCFSTSGSHIKSIRYRHDSSGFRLE